MFEKFDSKHLVVESEMLNIHDHKLRKYSNTDKLLDDKYFITTGKPPIIKNFKH